MKKNRKIFSFRFVATALMAAGLVLGSASWARSWGPPQGVDYDPDTGAYTRNYSERRAPQGGWIAIPFISGTPPGGSPSWNGGNGYDSSGQAQQNQRQVNVVNNIQGAHAMAVTNMIRANQRAAAHK